MFETVFFALICGPVVLLVWVGTFYLIRMMIKDYHG